MGFLENTEWYGIGALVIFFLFFLGVLAWVFRPGSTEKYSVWGNIPLGGDDVNGDKGDLAERDE